MIEYNSNFLKFDPIDPTTRKGKDRLLHFLERALTFRGTSPKKKGRMAFSYDENGRFGTPIYSENVVAVCDYVNGHVEEHVSNFCKKFCQLYLRTDDGANSIKFVRYEDFPKAEGYRAVLWIDGEKESPIARVNDFFGYVNDKPAFVLGKAMIDACRDLDMDSPQALARMEMIFHDSVDED